ncbi:mucin-associated surface protein (MASP), putative [Trypanosoma cruzi marinkellei]|uniref:Mucin-associated surface protein (MASP), putative n=1 Tax=Trypanosoma cruzi marinkellei TaxID=85056 RepID=K2MFW6_TRYCR|nr:mucin-associated surface protein (MASP), putative [Trypanosoma cruzi marinkellei]
MAMMMTGRVLLVCALCVLWCGIAGGVLAEGVDAVDGSAGEYSSAGWRAPPRWECAEAVSRRTGSGASTSTVEKCVHHGMDGVRAVVDGRRRWWRHRSAVAAADGSGNIGVPEIRVMGGLEKETSQEQSPKLTESSQGAGTEEARQPPKGTGDVKQKEPEIKEPEAAERPGEQITQTIEQEKPQGGQMPKLQQRVPDPASKQSKAEKDVDLATTSVNALGVKLHQRTKGEAENEEKANEYEAEEEIETEQDIAERAPTPIREKTSQSISPLLGSAAPSDRKEKPTTQDIAERLPISEVVLAEGDRQNGNTATAANVDSSTATSLAAEPDTATTSTTTTNPDTNNLNRDDVKVTTEKKAPKDLKTNLNSASGSTETATANNEVPRTAPDYANDKKSTTTPGDSDGSTAASHTTFPLLLLLVACAAAAAVVAA